ncbi:MAG: CARDB domain-containing protein, partial [Phycisphaerae bacterium]
MSVQNEVKGERNKVRLALFGGVHWKALVGLSCVIAVFDTPALARLGESSETKRGDKQSPVEHALDELPDSSPYTFVDDPNHVNDLTEEEERAQHGLPDPSPYTFVEDPGHVNDLTEEEERALLGEEWEANPLRLNANEMPGSDTLYAEVEIVLDGQFEIDDILALPQAPGGDFKVLDDETTVVIQIPLETVDRLAKQGADIRVLRSFQLFEGPAYGSVDNGVANASLACSGSFGNGSNGTNVPIPDNAGWVFSPISITGAAPGAIANCIDVHYEITHTWIGDLNVDLNDSNLTHNEDLWGPNQGGSANNLNETVTGITTFNGEAVNQTWKLYVKDIASADTGFIDYWWIKVYFGGPTGSADLIMQSASATPLTGITPGSTVTLADVAKNQGTGSSGSFRVGWYISTNPTMSQSDRQWCTRSAPPLSPGGTSPGGGTCAWPTSGTGSAPGPYWIAPMADYLNEVSESNEGNNWYAPPIQVIVGPGGGDLPDLIMQSASATPLTGITPGSTVTLADVAKNQGTGSSGSFRVGWYISTNPTMSQSDRQWCTRSAPPLSPGGTSPGGGTCAWPTSGTGSAPGPYWIAPMADYLNEVSESNEGNNWYAPPFQVEVGDGGGDVYEPDNTPTEATSVSCPTTQTHTVHAHGDVDWFAISLQNNASLTIETSNLSGSNPDTFVEIYDDGCGFLAGNDDGGSGLASRLVWSATYTGTHYVKARAFGGSTNHCNSQGGGPADMTYDISFTGCVPPPPIIRVEPLSLTFDCSSGPLSDTAPVTIRLKNAVLTPRPLSEREMAAVASARRSHLILHFADMPDEDGIEALAEQGVEILGYIPDHAVAASVPGGFVPDESSGIDWMGVFEPAFKIATSVSDVAVADDEPVQAVVVEFFSDVESAAALAILAGAGAEVIANDFLPAYVMAAWADSEAIQRLASKDAVAWILPASQAIINNQVTYWCPGPLTPWGP